MVDIITLDNGIEVEVVYDYTPAIISQDYDSPSWCADVNINNYKLLNCNDSGAEYYEEIEAKLYELNED